MKVGDLVSYLFAFDDDDEVIIEVFDAKTGSFVDSTVSVTISENNLTFGPALQIDIEADKFQKFL